MEGNTMTKLKITYWITTVLFSGMMLMSGWAYFTNPEMVQAFEYLGFPDYFRVELGAGKLLGALLLLAPFAGRLKEWVYAGFTINMLSASFAHFSLGDPASAVIQPLILLAILMVSYGTYHKLEEEIEPAFVSKRLRTATVS